MENIKIIGDLIYKALKEENIPFKELYFVDEEPAFEEDYFKYRLIALVDTNNGKSRNKIKYDIRRLLRPIREEYSLDDEFAGIGVCVYDDELFKANWVITNRATKEGIKYVG